MPLPSPRTPRAQRAVVMVLGLSLCVAGTALSACGSSTAPPAPSANQGAIVDEPTPNRVALVNQEGKPVTLGGLKGKVVVVAPFLSLCQDECPLITAAFIGLQRDLRAAGLADKVVFVEASVDPGRDTAARLAAYQREFGADWDLWTGRPTNVASFWKAFGVTYQIVPEGQPPHLDWYTGRPLTYDVVHTDGYFLIDTKGHERFIDINAPDLKGNLNKKLTSLLDAGGVHGLEHPQHTAWTVDQALASISWLLGVNVPPAGTS
jgi:cytochrome oxidase Cu insertion factor (SCO1/SenC/PrrC family)